MNPRTMKRTASLFALAFAFSANAQIIFQDGFENWTANLPDNWVGAKTNISTDSIEQVSVNVHGGSFACRLKNPDSGHKRFTTQALTVVDGEIYQVEFWARGSGEVRVGLFDGRPGGTSGYSPYSGWTTLGTTWTQVTQTILCANDTAGGEFILSVRNSLGAEHVVIDDVTITQGVVATPMSIHDIQYTTATDGASPAVGSAVATGGIVTALCNVGYWLQAGTGPWSGIFVSDTLTNVAEGDSITLQAIVEESFGLTRLNGVNNLVFEAGYPVPAPQSLDHAQSQSEPFESVLSRVVAVTCTNASLGFGEWMVDFGPAADSLRVDDLIYGFTPTVNDAYTLTGPMYFSFGQRKIEPRSAADIVAGIGETASLEVAVYPNPASERITIQREGSGRARYEVIDATGRTVIGQWGNATSIGIDLGALDAGHYMVRVIEADAIGTAAFTIVR